MLPQLNVRCLRAGDTLISDGQGESGHSGRSQPLRCVYPLGRRLSLVCVVIASSRGKSRPTPKPPHRRFESPSRIINRWLLFPGRTGSLGQGSACICPLANKLRWAGCGNDRWAAPEQSFLPNKKALTAKITWYITYL